MTPCNFTSKMFVMGILFAMLTSTSWGGIVCEEKKTEKGTQIEVTSPFYKIAIEPQNAGRIASWVMGGTQAELVHCGWGIGNLGRQTDLDFELPCEFEIKKHANAGEVTFEKVEVVFKSCVVNREKLDGLEFRKTFVFRGNTPYVQIHMEVVNHSAAKNISFRIYNDFRVGDKATATVFHQGASTLLSNPATAKKWDIWKDAGAGWGGVVFGSGLSLVAKSGPDTVSEVVTFAYDEFATYEIRFKPCGIDRGETAVIGDVFMAAMKAGTAEEALKKGAAAETYPAEVRDIAEARPMDRNAEVVLDKDSRRILLVGKNYRATFYRVESSLARSPGMAALVDRATFQLFEGRKNTLGFPVSAQGLSGYRMIVFIDMRYEVLPDATWNLVEKFTRAGGTVVFVGDHAADYEGKKITEIVPTRFDDAKRVVGGPEGLKVMDDRSAYADLEPVAADDPLLAGLDFGSKPQASVHKSVVKKDAVVRLKAGRWPVLTSWKVGKGTVYSFPICLTDKYSIPYDNDEPEYQVMSLATWEKKNLGTELDGEREKSIFLWSNYDDLWRRIANLALEGEQVPSISAFKSVWLAVGKLGIEFTAVNVPKDARGVLILKVEGEADRKLEDILLKDGRGTAEIKDLPETKDINYVLDIVKGKDVSAKLDGVVKKSRPASFELIAGHQKGLVRVYRRDAEFPYELNFSNEAKGNLALRLVDPWGKEVWKGEVVACGNKNGVVPLKGLASGHYVLQAQLSDEIEERAFDILEDLNSPDSFYFSNGSCLSDDAEEMIGNARDYATEGQNLILTSDIWRLDLLRWPARHRRAWGDQVMLAGMVPLHFDIGIGQSSQAAHQTEAQTREEIRKSQEFFEYAWGMAPEGIQTYIYDEPSHYENGKGQCVQCQAEYAKRYGGAVPKVFGDKTAPGYYRFARIQEDAMIDSLIRKGKMWKNTNSKMKLWGFTNEGMTLLDSALFMARAFGGFGLDIFSGGPGKWKAQYGYDMALAASDFDPAALAFQIESKSHFGGSPVASMRGQSMYSCLARGSRIIRWFDWEQCRRDYRYGIQPQFFECVKRATQEAKTLGPVLAGMKRPKGFVSMLVPTATSILGVGEAGAISNQSLILAYKAAQVSCGTVDFLYYQHLREGKLNDYKIMLLAGNDWIDEEMLGIIGKWVAAGGTLLVMPKSGNLSEELRPTRFFTETCPVKYGDKSAIPKVKSFPDAMTMAYNLESASGEALYSYEDGKPAAFRFAQGSGRVVVFGFAPENAMVLEKIFCDLKLDPAIVRSNDNDASASLLKSGETYYCVAVNSEEKAKDVELSLRIKAPGIPVAMDMLTGKKIAVARDANGRLKMKLVLAPFWGRAVALLPAHPEKLVIEVPAKTRPGEECVYRIKVLDGSGKVISGRIPLEISVEDGKGQQRKECGGYHVTVDGIYEKNIRLGTNDPIGTWKISALAPWGEIKTQSTFSVAD